MNKSVPSKVDAGSAATSTRRRARAAALALATCLAMVCATSGCGRSYPTVGGREQIELIAALRTACSSQRVDRLDKAAAAIERRHHDKELTDREYEAFQSIIQTARSGQWKEAEQRTFQFQQAQVR